MTISIAALNLLKRFEGCSLTPEWPGFKSGVTLGYGSDIGADPTGLEAWKPHVSADDFIRLEKAKGVTGEAAKPLAGELSDIAITPDAAEAVLAGYALPKFATMTLQAFPSADTLPDDSFGALVSLVYNRGPSLQGRKREEMAAICEHLLADAPDMVPMEFGMMSRHWPGYPTASNLPGRRFAEGHLFECGLREAGITDASTLILGDSGDTVKALQRTLRIAADGHFGPATLRSVLAWQAKQGFSPDGYPHHGMADVQTLRSLGL